MPPTAMADRTIEKISVTSYHMNSCGLICTSFYFATYAPFGCFKIFNLEWVGEDLKISCTGEDKRAFVTCSVVTPPGKDHARRLHWGAFNIMGL